MSAALFALLDALSYRRARELSDLARALGISAGDTLVRIRTGERLGLVEPVPAGWRLTSAGLTAITSQRKALQKRRGRAA